MIEHFVSGLNSPWLFLVIAASIAMLGKSADWLVKEAVALSEHWGVPKIVIGATIVSLGTTTPEAAVSVLAALQGDPRLALGNAVGSIICDTGLILGLACVISPLPLPPGIVNRQGWLQLGSGLMLIACCFPWSHPAAALQPGPDGGGSLPQVAGFAFLILLGIYLWLSVRWSKQQHTSDPLNEFESEAGTPTMLVLVKLLAAIALVILASDVLIASVREAAVRMSVPAEIVAATLVAFGTSTPELVTALVAVRHRHGDLAVGNVVGADILNVLFVAGAAAAVTPEGLHASNRFFLVLFPAMAGVLIVFRIGIFLSPQRLPRIFGVVLLVCYLAATSVSYLLTDPSDAAAANIPPPAALPSAE